MDSLNFFFGLKAVKTPYVSDMPLSETAIGYRSNHGTIQKVDPLDKELPYEQMITLNMLERQQVNNLNGSDCLRMDGSPDKSFK